MREGALHHLRASRRQWWLVVVTAVLTLVCGSVGVWQYEHAHATQTIHPVSGALGALYHSVQMLIVHTPHFEHGANAGIEAGRWLGAFTLIATTWILFWKRLTHEFCLLRLSHWKGHHVVCGLGRKGLGVVRTLKKKNSQAAVVVIDPNPEEGFADECAALGVCFMPEDATKPGVLARARVTLAREVIVITPEDETNVLIATGIRNACAAGSSGRVDCFVHLENIHLRERLQMLGETLPDGDKGCVLGFFDVFGDEARRVLTSLPLDGPGIAEDSPTTVHVVIMGFGRMGRSLALHAAKMGHFANRKPVRISVIDRDAERKREHFLSRYPILETGAWGQSPMCRLEFHQADVPSLRSRKLIEGWTAEADTLMHLFVCLDDSTVAVELGLRLQELLAGHGNRNLLIRIANRAALADILEVSKKAGPPIQVFGIADDCRCEQAFRHETNEPFARAAQEDFIRKRLAGSNRTPENDPALADWPKLREDFRDSNRQQADHAAIKLRAIGCEAVAMTDTRAAVTEFIDREVELLAEMEHARWNAERWLSGWRFGTPSNKDLRINENLRPWSDLDDSIQDYDRQAVANIPTILQSVAPPMKVVRKASVPQPP